MNPGQISSLPQRIAPTCQLLRERDQRLESLLCLASRLGHDFNNFLAPMVGYAALIKEEVAPESTVSQYAVAMENSARKAEGVIEDILVAARMPRQWRGRAVELGSLVDAEVAAWQKTLSPETRITLRQMLQPCVCLLDESQWRLAIQHLLRNARFALATGGVLEIDLRPESLSLQSAAELGLATTRVGLLTVRDHGFGMSQDTLHRAFEPFFSTRPKSQGMGLGLTIVHSVVRCHGGQISIESQEDLGTTVRIWIPLFSGVPTDVAEPGAEGGIEAEREPGEARKLVLLVDDDPLVLEVTKHCLQKSQFEVLTAIGGAAALKVCRKRAHELALVVSDITMPDMNGVELARAIRETDAHLPIVFVSGSDEMIIQESLTQLPPPRPRLITKPFQLKSLLEVVRKLAR